MKVYTTGRVSKLCHVSKNTVNKWFDSGKLKGFRVPGSRHRRIPRENLIQFLKQHGMPIDMLAVDEDELFSVLAVSRDQTLIEPLLRELTPASSIKVSVAASAFGAGADSERLRPDCIVLDFAIGDQQAQQICRNLRSKPVLSDTILLAVFPTGTQLATIDRSGINETFQRPFDPKLLAERIQSLMGSRADFGTA